MTDMKLAEEIEREGVERVVYGKGHAGLIALNQQIIAALRRGPEREGFYEKLWKDFVSLQRGDAQDIIAKVEAYYRERPSSGEMVTWAAEYAAKLTEAQARIAELEKAIVGECEDCGQMILTPLHPLPSVEKDAARYRWLRQSDCRDGVPFIAIFDGRLTQWTGKFADEQVDAAIDAALKSRA